MSVGTATVREVALLLAEAAGKRRSGIVTATKGKLKRLFCLDRGVIVHAASNLIEEQFEEHLVREKLLAPGDRARAKVSAHKNGRTLFAELEAEQVVEGKVLHSALEFHASNLVRHSLDFAEDGCGFQPGKPNLEGKPTVELSAVPLVLEHSREHPKSIDKVRIRIGPPDLRAELAPLAGHLLAGVPLDGAATFLTERADGSLDVNGLIEASPASRDETLRALMALLSLGVLKKTEQDRERDDGLHGLTRDECLARVHRADEATHYDVLGLDTSTDREAVRESYYFLARRYHPDRFRTGPLTDLLGRMESYFAKVTEAYNTLHDPEMRALYDEELGRDKKKDEPEQDTSYLARQNYARAQELIGRGRYADAVTFLENAIALQEAEPAFHLALGQVLSRNPRRRDDAARHLERAIELDPTSVAAKLDLGRVLRRLKQDDRAEELFREVLQWEPGNAEAADELRSMGLSP